jgi:hypothetical protein
MDGTDAHVGPALRPLLCLVAAACLGGACDQSIEIGVALGTREPEPTPVVETPNAGAASAAGGGNSVGGTSTTLAGSAQAGEGSMSAAGASLGAAGAAAPGIVWSTSVETGDTSDWTRDGAELGGTETHGATLEVSGEQAHSGSYAVKMTLDTTDGQDHGAELSRRVEAGAAYYSAWFLLTEAHTPAVYWSIFYFFTEARAGDRTTRRGLWDLNLNGAALYFYDETTKRFLDAAPKTPYPIGSWFHLEAYLDYGAGQLRVWQDGAQVLDVQGLGTPATDYVYWAIGSETDRLTPVGCTMYVDDVVISSSRVGP